MDPTIFQAEDFIDLAIHNLTRALIIGSLVVLLVIGLFLFEWRTALISLIAIPLSLLTAALVLDRRGATINTMVLTGMVIAVGVVVDDAIIDIENIVRRLRIARKEGTTLSTANVILDASLEVRSAIIYATLIDVATLLPIFFVQGLTGALFAPLALSYGLAVLASMLVALTVTPALGLILLGKVPGLMSIVTGNTGSAGALAMKIPAFGGPNGLSGGSCWRKATSKESLTKRGARNRGSTNGNPKSLRTRDTGWPLTTIPSN